MDKFKSVSDVYSKVPKGYVRFIFHASTSKYNKDGKFENEKIVKALDVLETVKFNDEELKVKLNELVPDNIKPIAILKDGRYDFTKEFVGWNPTKESIFSKDEFVKAEAQSEIINNSKSFVYNVYANYVERDKKNKIISLIETSTKYIPVLAFILTALYMFVKHYYAINLEKFYGVPKFYIFNEPKIELVFSIVFLILLAVSLLMPIILKKLNKYFNIVLSHTDCIYYSGLISVVVFIVNIVAVLILNNILQLNILINKIKNICNIFNNTIFDYILFGIILIIILYVTYTITVETYKYLKLIAYDNFVIKDNNKEKPNQGYQFITFDFSGFKSFFSKKRFPKNQIKVQLLHGTNLSYAVKYIMDKGVIRRLKKDKKYIAYWSESKKTMNEYEDRIVTNNDEGIILYAQYYDKVKDNANKLITYLLIFLFIIIVLLIQVYFKELDPANKKEYELLVNEDGTKSLIVDHYKDKVITMDYYELADINDREDDDKIYINKYFYDIKSFTNKKLEYKNFQSVYNEGYSIINLNFNNEKAENKYAKINSFAVKKNIKVCDLEKIINNKLNKIKFNENEFKISYWSTDKDSTDNYFNDNKDDNLNNNVDELVLYAQYD